MGDIGQIHFHFSEQNKKYTDEKFTASQKPVNLSEYDKR